MTYLVKFMTAWKAQSDGTRIASSVAFALALMYLVYYGQPYLPNLGVVHPWLLDLFGSRKAVIQGLAASAVVVVAVALVFIAYCGMRELRDVTPAERESAAKAGQTVVILARLMLCFLGAGIGIADVGRNVSLTSFDVLKFVVLSAAALAFMAYVLTVLFGQQEPDLLENPVARFAIRVGLACVCFLWGGYSDFTLALGAGTLGLMLLLVPIGRKVARQRAGFAYQRYA